MILLRTERDRSAVFGITQMTIPEKVVCMSKSIFKVGEWYYRQANARD